MDAVTQQEALKVIGANVRRLRSEKHMTQVTLAEKAEVSQTTVSQLEMGTKDFTIGTIARIAEVLGEPLDMLFRTEKAHTGQKSAGRRLTA